MERLDLGSLRNAIAIVGLALSGCVAKTPEADIKTPTATEVFVPVPGEEEIVNLETFVQSQLDEAFPDLNLHDTQMEGGGFLIDSSGGQYAFFETLYPPLGEGFNLELLLISEVEETGNIVWVKGLVRDEEETTDEIWQFKSVSYDSVNKSLVLEGPILRTETSTGRIEIFDGEAWKELVGRRDTQEQLFARLQAHTLSVPAPSATPVPTETPIPTETPTPTPTPNYIELGMSLHGVVAVEQRNGKWVGVDEQGLSIYRFNDETQAFEEVQPIRPQDITNEIRLYDRNRGQGRRKFPFGFYWNFTYETVIASQRERFKNDYVLSGILLEEPYYLEDQGFVVYIIGIPNSSNTKFQVLHVFNPVVEVGDEAMVSVGFLKIPLSPAGGFTYSSAYGDPHKPIDEELAVIGFARGRQIAFGIDYIDSLQLAFEEVDSILNYIGPGTGCQYKCVRAFELIKEHLEETYEILRYIKTGDTRYNGMAVYISTGPHIPIRYDDDD